MNHSVTRPVIETVARDHYGRLVALLCHRTRDPDAAADAVGAAFLAAIEAWPRVGVPERPEAWLLTAARHHAVERWRREQHRADQEHAVIEAIESLLEQANAAPKDIPDERLRELMTTEGASPSERFRRLVEAYQIEVEYGRTVSDYKSTLPDGREAEFVRVGRVSLLYRTVDGEECGYWDAAQKQWVIDNEYNSAVLEALRISRKTLAPDVIKVPVPAPQEVRS